MPSQGREKTASAKPARQRKTTTTTAKPRTTASRSRKKNPVAVCESQIRERAYYIFLERGGHAGDPAADWLQAEQELKGQTSSQR